MRLERIKWELRIALALLVVSFVLYALHFVFFKDLRHICLWSLTSLAFLPISVLVVTLLINRLLNAREKALRLDKLNMLIGTFFSNVGMELLRFFSSWDANNQYLRNHFGTADVWSKIHPREVKRLLTQHSYEVTIKAEGLDELKQFLTGKIDFLMRLLENPNLLEQEIFAELLRAVFHLTEELTYRENIPCLPDSDIGHLAGDVKRCYGLLVREWADYMRYLKTNYPYLFSLAIRTNPLDHNASPIIE